MRFIHDKYGFETTKLIYSSRSLYCTDIVNTMMGMAVSHVLMNNGTIDGKQNMVLNKNIKNIIRKNVII